MEGWIGYLLPLFAAEDLRMETKDMGKGNWGCFGGLLRRLPGRWFALLGLGGMLLGLATCDRESPQDYIRRFRSMDPKVRTRAANQLIRFDADEVVPLLIEEAGSEYVRVRFEVMKMLGRFKDPRGIPVLIKGLDDKSPRVAAVAAWGLGELRAPEALSALLMYAHDPTTKVRQYVIGALGSCHSYDRAPALSDSAYSEVVRALEAPDPAVRVAALQSIREFGYRGVSEQILRMACDPSPEVRHVVVQALGEMGATREPGKPPRSIVGRRAPTVDPIRPVSDEVRRRIVDALIESLAPDEYQSIRTKAIRALGEIGDERALPALRRLVGQGTEEDVREARRAIESIQAFQAGSH